MWRLAFVFMQVNQTTIFPHISRLDQTISQKLFIYIFVLFKKVKFFAIYYA